jgi:hypothetical protein
MNTLVLRDLPDEILTNGRRSRYHVRVLDGLDLVAAAGFERIAVAWPQESEN